MTIVHVLISIGFYFVLMWISVNLLGLLVRGFLTNPELDEIEAETKHDFIKEEIEKLKRADKWLNVIAFMGIIGYLYTTFHFWNIGVTCIALLLMFVRLPGLLWEIKTGEKVTRSAAREMPKNALHFITTFLTFAALPALYYFLYPF